MRKKNIKKLITATAVILISCCISCAKTDIEEDYGDGYSLINVGDKLPSFSVVDNFGNTYSDKTINGSVAMIVFFNTSCGDCQKELPVINDIYIKFCNRKDFKLVAISREQNKLSVDNYWTDKSFSLPFCAEEDRTVYNKFATQIIPRIYIVNKNNTVSFKYDDEAMPDTMELATAIKSLY